MSGWGGECPGSLLLAGVPVVRAVQEEFPQFRIWREVVRDRARYVACSRVIGVRPHTLVTGDLEELRAGLSAAWRVRLTGRDPADRGR